MRGSDQERESEKGFFIPSPSHTSEKQLDGERNEVIIYMKEIGK